MKDIMTTMQASVFKALRSIGIQEDVASDAAESLAKRDADVIDLKSDMRLLKWMLGFVLAFQPLVVSSLFGLWLKQGDFAVQIATLTTQMANQSSQIANISTQIASISTQLANQSAQISAIAAKIH